MTDQPLITQLSQQIATGQRAGGILFVQNAALASCFANRIPAIKAVVGTHAKSVEIGVKELGANVLILEYSQLGSNAMSQYINQFLQGDRSNASRVERQLKELSR